MSSLAGAFYVEREDQRTAVNVGTIFSADFFFENVSNDDAFFAWNYNYHSRGIRVDRKRENNPSC